MKHTPLVSPDRETTEQTILSNSIERMEKKIEAAAKLLGCTTKEVMYLHFTRKHQWYIRSFYESSINELNLNGHTKCALENRRLDTIADLFEHSDKELRKKGISQFSVSHMREYLSYYCERFLGVTQEYFFENTQNNTSKTVEDFLEEKFSELMSLAIKLPDLGEEANITRESIQKRIDTTSAILNTSNREVEKFFYQLHPELHTLVSEQKDTIATTQISTSTNVSDILDEKN